MYSLALIIFVVSEKFGSFNGRSMNMYYYGTSKSSTIWLPNQKKLKEKSCDLNRNSSRNKN
jgi:hypothetical protein